MASVPDLCAIPAAPAPPGLSNNFENPTTLTAAVLAVVSILVAWATTFVVARIYMHFRRFSMADLFVLIALCMSIAMLGIMGALSKTYRHIWDVPACYFNGHFTRVHFFFSLTSLIGLFFAKASIFLLFLQIFSTQQMMRTAIWVGIVLTFMIYGAGVAVAIYYETPRLYESWAALLDGRLLIPIKWWQAQSGLIVALDFYIFVLPLPAISKLQMPKKRQIQIVAVFSLALLGIGSSIASLVERITIANAIDQTWISAILSLCTAVELNVAIIVSCGPAFSSFSRVAIPKLASTKSLLSSIFSGSSSNISQNSQRLPESISEKDGASKTVQSTQLTTDSAFEHDYRYYGLGFNGRPTSQATVVACKQGNPSDGCVTDGGILRTLTVEQKVVTPTASESIA